MKKDSGVLVKVCVTNQKMDVHFYFFFATGQDDSYHCAKTFLESEARLGFLWRNTRWILRNNHPAVFPVSDASTSWPTHRVWILPWFHLHSIYTFCNTSLEYQTQHGTVFSSNQTQPSISDLTVKSTSKEKKNIWDRNSKNPTDVTSTPQIPQQMDVKVPQSKALNLPFLWWKGIMNS